MSRILTDAARHSFNYTAPTSFFQWYFILDYTSQSSRSETTERPASRKSSDKSREC